MGAGATTAGAMFSAVVIGAQIPQRMGDGTLTEEQLQSMGRAPFVRNDDAVGKREKYEIHHRHPISEGGQV
ncbi:hypothetical protein ACEK07_44250 [Alcanivoracaceae bacterium MT1]